MDTILLIHQLLYAVFSLIFIIVFLSQILLHAYYKYHNSPLKRRFGVIQRTYHWCCLGGTLVFAFKSVDPIGYHGWLTIPILYLVQDFCSYLILLAVFVTIFEACCACYSQLDLYGDGSDDSPQSLTPKILAWVLALLWLAVCIAVLTLDVMNLFHEEAFFRGLIYFCYAATFTFVTLLLQWIGADLNKNFHRLIPSMFSASKTTMGEIALLFLGASGPATDVRLPRGRTKHSQPSFRTSSYGGRTEESEERIDGDDLLKQKVPRESSRSSKKSKSQTSKSTVSAKLVYVVSTEDGETNGMASAPTNNNNHNNSSGSNGTYGGVDTRSRGASAGSSGQITDQEGNLPESSSQTMDPILVRLYQKFIRFLIFRRLAQLLGVLAVTLLVFYGYSTIFIEDPEEKLPSEGVYNIEDDALCWFQACAIILGVWYSWVPFHYRGVVAVPEGGVDSLMNPSSNSIQADYRSDHGAQYYTNTTEDDT